MATRRVAPETSPIMSAHLWFDEGTVMKEPLQDPGRGATAW